MGSEVVMLHKFKQKVLHIVKAVGKTLSLCGGFKERPLGLEVKPASSSESPGSGGAWGALRSFAP